MSAIPTLQVLSVHDVLFEAANLVSEDGDNPEYDRALVELCTRVLGLSHDEDGATVARLIGVRP